MVLAEKNVAAAGTWDVDITPHPSLLKKTGQQNYRIPDALGELVDNEIDARLPGEKLVVRVTVKMGKTPAFIVEGNGAGMTKDEAEQAMRLAYSAKREDQIGEFGLGMKAACTNLGGHFEVITCTAGAVNAIRIVYDEDAFLSAGKWKLRLEGVEKPFDHGTRVTITAPKVKLYGGVKDTILLNFGRIFKHFVRSGDVEILVNEEPVTPETPKLIDEYTKQFSFEVQGQKVHGWYGLQEKYSTTGGYGFELIRNDRAMLRHEKIGFKPHPRLARLIGEIHLDTFPVANNKMDFMRDTELWREFEETLGRIIAEIRGIAGQLASRKVEAKDKVQIDEEVGAVQDALNSKAFEHTIYRRGLDQLLTEQEESEEGSNEPVEVPARTGGEEQGDGRTPGDPSADAGGDPRRKARKEPRVTEERLKKVRASLPGLQLHHDFIAVGADAPYKLWDLAQTNPEVRLEISTNLDHPMYGAYGEDLTLWVKHNVVEAAAEYLCREQGTRDMIIMKSDILKHVGRLKLEDIEAAPTLA